MPKTSSENIPSAENQQERLIKIGWIVGFVDGEGCFSIGIIKQKSSTNNYRYQIFHEFVVTQSEKSLSSLKQLKNHFGVGSITSNKRYDNHKGNLY